MSAFSRAVANDLFTLLILPPFTGEGKTSRPLLLWRFDRVRGRAKGLPEAIEAVYPQAEVQFCIVQMVRNSLKFVSCKDRKKIADDLKTVYRAATVEQAEEALAELERTWDSRYPMIGKSWRANWSWIIPFFAYSEPIRKVIYTTDAIESVNNSLRKVTKNRNCFPSDEAAVKLLYMALKHIAKKWTMPIQNWNLAIHQFSIRFEGRVQM